MVSGRKNKQEVRKKEIEFEVFPPNYKHFKRLIFLFISEV